MTDRATTISFGVKELKRVTKILHRLKWKDNPDYLNYFRCTVTNGIVYLSSTTDKEILKYKMSDVETQIKNSEFNINRDILKIISKTKESRIIIDSIDGHVEIGSSSFSLPMPNTTIIDYCFDDIQYEGNIKINKKELSKIIQISQKFRSKNQIYPQYEVIWLFVHNQILYLAATEGHAISYNKISGKLQDIKDGIYPLSGYTTLTNILKGTDDILSISIHKDSGGNGGNNHHYTKIKLSSIDYEQLIKSTILNVALFFDIQYDNSFNVSKSDLMNSLNASKFIWDDIQNHIGTISVSKQNITLNITHLDSSFTDTISGGGADFEFNLDLNALFIILNIVSSDNIQIQYNDDKHLYCIQDDNSKYVAVLF